MSASPSTNGTGYDRALLAGIGDDIDEGLSGTTRHCVDLDKTDPDGVIHVIPAAPRAVVSDDPTFRASAAERWPGVPVHTSAEAVALGLIGETDLALLRSDESAGWSA